MTDRVILPSGNSIDRETWDAMKESGSWCGWLDPKMYPADDRAFMDAQIGA